MPSVDDHDGHMPAPDLEERSSFLDHVKKKITEDPSQSVRVHYNWVSDRFPISASVPPFNSVRSSLNRVRSKKCPQEPSEIGQLLQIRDPWGKTLDNRQFHITTYTDDDEGWVLLGSEVQIRKLQESATVHVDGTFKSCPLLFSQVYIFCARANGKVVPVAYALKGV
jgi:hypothetical protein